MDSRYRACEERSSSMAVETGLGLVITRMSWEASGEAWAPPSSLAKSIVDTYDDEVPAGGNGRNSTAQWVVAMGAWVA